MARPTLAPWSPVSGARGAQCRHGHRAFSSQGENPGAAQEVGTQGSSSRLYSCWLACGESHCALRSERSLCPTESTEGGGDCVYVCVRVGDMGNGKRNIHTYRQANM